MHFRSSRAFQMHSQTLLTARSGRVCLDGQQKQEVRAETPSLTHTCTEGAGASMRSKSGLSRARFHSQLGPA